MWCDNLTQEEWYDKYDTNEKIMRNLHGKCDEWALKNYKHGDTFIIWNHYNEELEKVSLVHCFLKRNDMYVDVRGETTNIELVKEGFEYNEDDNNFYPCETISEYKHMIRHICGYKDDIWK